MFRIPRDGRGYVANLPTYGPLLILPHALKCWGPPTHGKGCGANPPTCGPLLLLSPAGKHWGPPNESKGLCSKSSHLWAIAVFVPYSEALGTPVAKVPICGPKLISSPTLKRWGPPKIAGVVLPIRPLVGPYCSCPPL